MNRILKIEFLKFRSNLLESDLYNISDREFEVIFLVTKGMSNKSIGESLYISETTVKKHMSNIFNKIGIKSRYHLIVLFNNSIKEQKLNMAC